jgi:hypothetical protein
MDDSTGVTDPAMPAAWIELTGHPHFAAAAHRLASNMLSLGDEDRRLAAVFKDAGRYVAAMSAAYLHGIGGLTLPLLKQICAGSGFLSAGRARAIVEFLVHVDYLHGAAANGEFSYQPTERFLSAWCRHLQAAVEAAELIEPSLATLPSLLDDRRIFEQFLAVQAARLHALTRGADPFPTLNRVFLHPYAGSQILWTLTVTGGDTFAPGPEPVDISLSALSRRFDVTHLHVRRLLKKAQEEGFITYHGNGRLTVEPGGARTIALYYGFQLTELVATGLQTLAAQATDSRGSAPDRSSA